MNPQQIDEIIEQLKVIRKDKDVETFKEMNTAMNDLTAYRKAGSDGKVPHLDALRAWGLIPEDAPAETLESQTPVIETEPTLSAANVNQVLNALRARIAKFQDEGQDDTAEYDAMNAVLSELLSWRKQGMTEPAPHLDTLARWGIFPPSSTATRPQTPSSAPSAVVAETSPRATTEYEGEQDTQFEERYREAEAKARDGFYYEARNIYRELESQVRGRLREPVKAGLTKANTELTRRTTYLVEQAKGAQRKKPKDAVREKEAWLAVTKENPDVEEANNALTRLTQEITDQEVRKEIRGLLERAKDAAAKDNLPDLNNFFGRVQGLRARGDASPGEMSGGLYDELVNLETEIAKLRAETRKKLGQFSTLLTGGYYKPAYVTARDYMNRAVPVLIDETGFIGAPGLEVETTRFFQVAREQFLTALRNLVAQRLEKAKGEEKENPDLAKTTLQEAEAMLTDDVLIQEDKQTLQEQLSQVQKQLAIVENKLGRYNAAKDKVEQAQRTGITQRDALKLYREAKVEYADFPDLEIRMEQAEQAVAEVVGTEVAGQITEAQRKLNLDQFDAALKLLQKAATDAIQELPHPKPNSGLAHRLQDLARVEEEIKDAEKNYLRMMGTLNDFDTYVEQFRKGDAMALQLARNQLERLTDQERQHNETRRRMSDLVALQGDAGNWETGANEYRRKNWETAELNLRQVASSQNPNRVEAERMANRALACLTIVKAREAEGQAKWKEARNNYDTASRLFKESGTDSQTAAVADEVTDALRRLEPIARNDDQVRSKINQAKRKLGEVTERVGLRASARAMVQPMPQFGQAFDLITEAEQLESTLEEEVDRLKQEIRDQWRSAFLNGMKEAVRSDDLEVLKAGMGLADTLRDQMLLFDTREEQLARELQERYLDAEYDALSQTSPKPWTQLEENRQRRRRALRIPTKEINEQYMNALRERIKEEVGRRRSKVSREEARAYLKQELEKLSLPADEELARRAFELCWELEDWEEADHLADDLEMNYPEESTAWKGLTRAAKLFQGGLVQEGAAEMEELKERYKQNNRLTQLLNEKEKTFREKTIDVLAKQAQEFVTRGGEDDLIEAATKYALMYEINDQDARARKGLEQVGKKLEPGLKKLFRRADGLKVGQRPLDETLRDADTLYVTLHAMHAVADAKRLPLPADLKSTMFGVVQRLGNKRDKWKAVQDYLNQEADELDNALKTPVMLDDKDPERGGWNFAVTNSILGEAQKAAAGDGDCILLVQQEQGRVSELTDTGNDMRGRVFQFLAALRVEDFDNTMRLADDVANRWRQVTARDAWGGLDILTRYHFKHIGRWVVSPEEHKTRARERKVDWEEWQRWSASVVKSNAQTNERAKGLQGTTIDEVQEKSQYSLTQTIKLAAELRASCAEFEAVYEQQPQKGPLSDKAEQEKNKAQDQWVATVSSTKSRAASLEEEARKRLEKLERADGPLSRLKKVLAVQIDGWMRAHNDRVPPDQNLAMLEREYKTVADIDPYHDEALKTRKKLDELKKRKGSEPPSKFLGLFGGS